MTVNSPLRKPGVRLLSAAVAAATCLGLVVSPAFAAEDDAPTADATTAETTAPVTDDGETPVVPPADAPEAAPSAPATDPTTDPAVGESSDDSAPADGVVPAPAESAPATPELTEEEAAQQQAANDAQLELFSNETADEDTVVEDPAANAQAPEAAAGLLESRAAGQDVFRYAGATSYDTALSVFARDGVYGKPLVLVTGRNYPDGLSAGALAGYLKGNLLAVNPGGLTNAVANEIWKKNPSRIYIIGGVGAVPERIVKKLENTQPSSSYAWISRYSGSDRYKTSIRVANQFSSWDEEALIVAQGNNFPDALSATTLSGVRTAPILLDDRNAREPNDDILSQVRYTRGKTVYLIGAMWRQTFINALRNAAYDEGMNFMQLAGKDRFQTNNAILREAWRIQGGANFDEAVVVNGYGFADALAVSGYVPRYGAAMVMTKKNCYPVGPLGFAQRASTLRLIGGPASLTYGMRNLNRCAS